MKKLYLLAFMAGATLGLSAQTWIQTQLQAVPMTQIQNNLKANAPGSLLRAADTRSLPDSVYSSNSLGEYDKTYYKYTEDGKMAEELKYQFLWTDAPDGDYFRMCAKREYDEHGNMTRYIYENGFYGTVLTQTYKNTYDEQGRLSSVYIPEDHSISNYEYDGNNYIYTRIDTTEVTDESISLILYKEEDIFDDAGNRVKQTIYSYSTWDDEWNPIWYPQTINEYTYNDKSFILTGRTTQYDEEGNVTYEFYYENEFLDESGKNFIQHNDWVSFGNKDATKYEVEGENPEIEYMSSQNEDGTWTERGIRQIRFYPGPLTANETIKADTPALKAYSADGTLFINLSGTAPVQVYSVNGTCHYNATASGNITIANLPAGIYVVKAGDETVKISVR